MRDWLKIDERHRLPLALVLYLASLATLAAIGYDFYADQERRFEDEAKNQLQTIADLKAVQLSDWRKERISDGEVLQANYTVVPAIERMLEGAAPADAIASIAFWRSVQSSHGYSNVTLLDKRGVVRLSLGSETRIVGFCSTIAKEALNSRRVTLADFHRESESGPIHLSVAVPVPAHAQQEPRGVILLWIDPNTALYPLIQAWPSLSKTGEALLVRREGNDVLYLNELRHRKNTALRLKLPIVNNNQNQVPAAAAVSGREGVWSGIDYRGVEVVAAARRVPDSPWYLVAKVDADELYTPAHQRSRILAFILLLGLLATGPAIGLVWYRQRSRVNLVRHESEVARRALVGHYSYLSRHANDIILLEEEDGRIIEANERAEQSYGYDHEELLRLNIRDLLEPESLAEFEYRWQAPLNPSGVLYETVHHRKDGSAFPVEVSARMIEVDGEPFRQAIVRDITERKRNEDRVRRAGAYNRRLLETSLDPLVTIDPQGRIADVNTATENVTGFLREDLLGTDFSEYFTEPLRARAAYRTAFREGQIQDYELEIRHRDGRVTQVTYNASVYRDKTGEVVGVFAAARDITERKRIYSELEQLNQELELRVQRRTAQLAAANNELEAFAYSVSHDLRAPLRAIHGFSRILTERYAPELTQEAQRYLETIRQNALRMGVLIDDLLALSRFGRQPLKVQMVALGALVRQALDELADQLDGRQIEMVIGELPTCAADPMLLKQVLLNLLSNAIKYTRHRDKALIQVSCARLIELTPPEIDGAPIILAEADPNILVYYVRDNGAGFDMRYADKLFGVFQRLHSQAEYDGTGVGLAIVERIIRRHGGSVWAQGKVDEGATLYFTIGNPA